VNLDAHHADNRLVSWGSYPEGAATKMESADLKEDGSTLAQAFGPAENGTGRMVIQAASVFPTTHAYATITVSAAVTEGKCRFQANYTVALQQF
jgi:hypothetical protein